MAPFAPSSWGSDGLLIGSLHIVHAFDVRRHDRAHQALLFGDTAYRIDDLQAVLLDDAIVFGEHLALKQTEAFSRLRAPAEIHAGFVKLQLNAARHQAIERDVNRDAEIQR